MEIKPGDIFLSRNPMSLGRIINAVQALQAQDKKSVYSHAGIIVNRDGTTIEALWTVKSQNLFDSYKGQRILIARWDKMSPVRHKLGLAFIRDHIGQFYPLWRMVMMITPILVRYATPGWRLVCSEIVGKYLHGAGEDIQWLGLTPDAMHDIIRKWAGYTIIYEGECPERTK